MVKNKYILFGPSGVFLYYKIQVHSKESYTVALHTQLVFKGIKVLLHYELQLHSGKSKHYCIIYYKCIQRIQSIIGLQNESKKRKCYCNIKKLNSIYYVLTLFENTALQTYYEIHVKGTKSCKLSLWQSKYTLLSTGQSNNH